MKKGYTYTWLSNSGIWFNSRSVYTRPTQAADMALAIGRYSDPDGSFFWLADDADATQIDRMQVVKRLQELKDVVLINTNGSVAVKLFSVDIR